MGKRRRNQKAKPLQTLCRVYVSSRGIETLALEQIDPVSGRPIIRRFLQGAINGQAFRVPCDEQVDVPENIATLLRPLIKRQNLQ